MLKLKDIKKDYLTGDQQVHALKGINLGFRESEFVAILGHSGCGKTTLLNIIGGLDKYTSGDLIMIPISCLQTNRPVLLTRRHRCRSWNCSKRFPPIN